MIRYKLCPNCRVPRMTLLGPTEDYRKITLTTQKFFAYGPIALSVQTIWIGQCECGHVAFEYGEAHHVELGVERQSLLYDQDHLKKLLAQCQASERPTP